MTEAPGPAARPSDDDGLTMVELIVYGVLSALFLTVLATMFIQGMQASATTTNRDAATGSVQVITNSIQTSIRNSNVFCVADSAHPGSCVTTGSGNILIARVAKGTSDWECRAWAITASKDLLYTTRSSAFDTSRAISTAGWTKLAGGVAGTPGSTAPLVAAGIRLDLYLQVTVGDATVPVTGGATAQASGEGNPRTCW